MITTPTSFDKFKIKLRFFSLLVVIFVQPALISSSNGTHEKYVALILARGGSKSIPYKNLAIIETKSLLKRTIETALHSQVFDEVWVSTDYLNIYQEAERAGANVFGRSADSASDSASSFQAVKEFYDFFTNITVLALLQCTSPFHSIFAMRKAYEMMRYSEYDSVFSVTSSYKLRWKRFAPDIWRPINFDLSRRPRRQDMRDEFIENGMFYWFRTELLRNNVLQGGRIGTVIIPNRRSMEIDTPEDLMHARTLAKHIIPSIENEKYQCFSEQNEDST